MDEVKFFDMIFLYLLMLTWFRMSIRQIVLILGYSTISSILYGIIVEFSRGINLIICGDVLLIVIIIGFYIFSYKKDGVQFDQPLFEKGTWKVLLKGIRDVLTKDKK